MSDWLNWAARQPGAQHIDPARQEPAMLAAIDVTVSQLHRDYDGAALQVASMDDEQLLLLVGAMAAMFADCVRVLGQLTGQQPDLILANLRAEMQQRAATVRAARGGGRG
jgi:hypothetical protein